MKVETMTTEFLKSASELAITGGKGAGRKLHEFGFEHITLTQSCWIPHTVIAASVLRTKVARWNHANESRPLRVINHSDQKQYEVAANVGKTE